MKSFKKLTLLSALLVWHMTVSHAQDPGLKRLEKLLNELPADRHSNGPPTPLDKNYSAMVKRLKIYPPDFKSLSPQPYLPDPLRQNNKKITTLQEWSDHKEKISEDIKYWLTGDFPPAPDNVTWKILSEKQDGKVLIKQLELSFGPESKGKMRVELYIPKGATGRLPVFMTQWYHKGWARIAVQRGYIGCVYAAADDDDDTESYADLYPEYSFMRLMRRAWGGMRVVDMLHKMPEADTNKIAIAGHSRNGKQSLWATAFDSRIDAVISSSSGFGGALPARLSDYELDPHDDEKTTNDFPMWYSPRLRFFCGREHLLPTDFNMLQSLIAPRPLLYSVAFNDAYENHWGVEQAFLNIRPVYQLYEKPDNLAIYYRPGDHGTASRDAESYMDFLDHVFGIRTKEHPTWTTQPIVFDIEPWKKDHAVNKQVFDTIKTLSLKERLSWLMGEAPAVVNHPGPATIWEGKSSPDVVTKSFRSYGGDSLSVMHIGPYNEMGDYQFADLFYPKNAETGIKKNTRKLPVVLYLHAFNYSSGYAKTKGKEQLDAYFIQALCKKGYSVLAFDLPGFGSRIEDGRHFYERYPNWSLMGKTVQDVKSAVDMLYHLSFIDTSGIILAGYSLGATTAAIYSVFDKRIRTMALCGGLDPWKNPDNQVTAGIGKFYGLHPLLPRLSFFEKNESDIPADFEEMLLDFSPRNLYIDAPLLDRHINQVAFEKSLKNLREIYPKEHLSILRENRFNRFDKPAADKMVEWIVDRLRPSQDLPVKVR